MRISELCGLALGDLDPDAAVVRVFGKGAKERIVPARTSALAAVADWRGPSGRPRLAPARWARRGDADALFLNQRGGRLSRQAGWADRHPLRRAGRPRRPAEPARPAPLVRHPHARPRRRPAGRPGAPRPRFDLDHAGVHEGLRRPPPDGVRVRPPTGAALTWAAPWPTRPTSAGASSARCRRGHPTPPRSAGRRTSSYRPRPTLWRTNEQPGPPPCHRGRAALRRAPHLRVAGGDGRRAAARRRQGRLRPGDVLAASRPRSCPSAGAAVASPATTSTRPSVRRGAATPAAIRSRSRSWPTTARPHPTPRPPSTTPTRSDAALHSRPPPAARHLRPITFMSALATASARFADMNGGRAGKSGRAAAG